MAGQTRYGFEMSRRHVCLSVARILVESLLAFESTCMAGMCRIVTAACSGVAPSMRSASTSIVLCWTSSRIDSMHSLRMVMWIGVYPLWFRPLPSAPRFSKARTVFTSPLRAAQYRCFDNVIADALTRMPMLTNAVTSRDSPCDAGTWTSGPPQSI